MSADICSPGKGYSCSSRATAACGVVARSSCAWMSEKILPLHRTSRSTPAWSICGSSIAGWNEASARSARVDVASLSLKSPFGVITTSGRAVASSACLPEEVEELAGRGAVDDADVVLCGGELEEALEARARVLGAVPLVAVRQEQRQP